MKKENMMKKTLRFLMAIALLCSLSISVFAEEAGETAEVSTGGNQAVKATVTGSPSWELVIPADQTIQYLTEVTDIVHDDCEINNPKHIPANSTINASLTHTGVFLNSYTGQRLNFTLQAYGKEVEPGKRVIVSQYWSDTRNNSCYNEINMVISRENWKNAEGGSTYTTNVFYTSELAEGEITDPADGFPRPEF